MILFLFYYLIFVYRLSVAAKTATTATIPDQPKTTDERMKSRMSNAVKKLQCRPSAEDIKRIWVAPTPNRWEPQKPKTPRVHLRVFISYHRSTKQHSDIAEKLKEEMGLLGVSSFVDKSSIEPGRRWSQETERALWSMDAMLALVTNRYHERPWTNQEIGFAYGRSVPILGLMLEEAAPKGLFGELQATDNRDPNSIFDSLKNLLIGTSRWNEFAISQFCNAGSFDEARSLFQDLETLNDLKHLKDLTNEQVNSIKDAVNENDQLTYCGKVQADIADFLMRLSSARINLTFDEGKNKLVQID